MFLKNIQKVDNHIKKSNTTNDNNSRKKEQFFKINIYIDFNSQRNKLLNIMYAFYI